MKKKKIVTLICSLACVASLTACSADTSVSFSFRWNPNGNNEVLHGTSERYEYVVEIEPESGSNDDYSVEYSNGKYTTELSAVTVDAEEKLCYLWESALTISVIYTCGNEKSETFTDTVTSKVWFTGESDLRPIRSEKTTQCVSPVAMTANKLTDCYQSYHYKTTIEYNETATKGTYKREDLGAGTVRNEEKTFSVSSKNSYLDNEQLLFALRGITSSSSQTIESFDVGEKKTRTMSVSKSDAESKEFELYFNSETLATLPIDYVPNKVSYSGSNSGGTQTVFIAQTTENNKYRNMILGMEVPLPFNLGTLVYRLTKAYTF